MSELRSGFQERDIKEGFQALAGVRNWDDLDGLIETLPVLSSPVFHAELRHFRQERADELGTERANFMAIYDALFLRLHQRAYLEQIKAARSQGARTTPPIGPLYAPPFFLALVSLLNGQLPLQEGPCYDPASDVVALAAELSNLLGRTIQLPAYKPTVGSLWGATLLDCANCGHPRLGIRAHYIDLVQAPDLLVPLEEKRIDADLCPQCGAQVVVPKRVWVQERPNPLDPLAALSCLLFANPSELIYLAPPGTIPNADYDRILEVRAEVLTRQLSWSPQQAIGNSAASGPFSLVILYSADELADYIRATTVGSPPLPVDYLNFVASMARQLASGLTPVYRIIETIREQIPIRGKEWPIIVYNVADQVEEPFTALVQNLIAQACAEVQGLPAGTRAELTMLVAESLLILHQTALAEAQLARAEDLINTAPPDVSGLEDARRLLAQVRAELLHAQGQPRPEPAMPQRPPTQDTQGGDSRQDRLMQILALNNEALGARDHGRFSEALPAFFYCINNLQKLEEEVRTDAAHNGELLRGIRYHLSGAQANLGMTLADIAEYLDLSSKLQQSGERPKLTPKVRALIARAGSTEGLSAQLEEIIKNTVPILNSILPAGYTTRTLLEIASRYLQTALAISEEVEGYDYACIQAYQLAYVLEDLNQPAEATAMMRQSMKHAAHIEDYPHLSSGSVYLAERAMGVGQGQEALAQWKEYVRYLIRGLATSGGTAFSMQQSQSAIADKALSCVALGGEPAAAIMIAESVRGIATALSILRGVPLQSRADAHANDDLGAARLSSLLKQRESLRLQVMWNEAQREPLKQQIIAVEQELEKARRDLSLQDPRYARWSDATHLEVSDERVIRRILRDMGPRTTLVGFLPTVASVWVYALWEDGQIIVERQLPTELLAALDAEPVQGRAPGGRTPETGTVERQVGQRPDSQPYLNKHLQAAARVLLEPLTERLVKLTPQDRLILSPCEPLDLLPFVALPFRGRPLCEQAVLSIVQGSGMLEACGNRPRIPVRTAVCIGAPTRSDVPDLPGALEEVRRVADLLRAANVQVQLLIEERATIAALQNISTGSDLVHFSCHAGSKTPDERWAQLLLAPDPQAPDSGILSEDQILSNLLLKEGCLVNLAGCRTGLLGNEGRYLRGGLVPAFLVAGAGSVIGSLWPLEDWPATSFQSAFYQRLIAGVQPAEALAITQRECIAGKRGSRLQDVRNWGSYLVYGIG